MNKSFKNLLRKSPLKIKVSWEWNHKSKKQLLRIEINRLLDIIKRYENQVPAAYIQNIPAEAKSDE